MSRIGRKPIELPEAVTVELLAAWIHEHLADPLRGDGAEVVSVRVWESEDAFGGLRARV